MKEKRCRCHARYIEAGPIRKCFGVFHPLQLPRPTLVTWSAETCPPIYLQKGASRELAVSDPDAGVLNLKASQIVAGGCPLVIVIPPSAHPPSYS